jgi:hypothetical protein
VSDHDNLLGFGVAVYLNAAEAKWYMRSAEPNHVSDLIGQSSKHRYDSKTFLEFLQQFGATYSEPENEAACLARPSASPSPNDADPHEPVSNQIIELAIKLSRAI